MSTIKDLYKAHYDFYCSCSSDDYPSKYEWAANDIFDLTTYDSSLDELFIKDILEVCKTIIDEKNFEYIENKQNYIKYILVCQLLVEFHWIDWGTSIRGAWFDMYPDHDPHPITKEDEWSDYNDDTGEWQNHVLDEVPFTVDNLKVFIEFMEE